MNRYNMEVEGIKHSYLQCELFHYEKEPIMLVLPQFIMDKELWEFPQDEVARLVKAVQWYKEMIMELDHITLQHPLSSHISNYILLSSNCVAITTIPELGALTYWSYLLLPE